MLADKVSQRSSSFQSCVGCGRDYNTGPNVNHGVWGKKFVVDPHCTFL